ncbi:hypothetical protein R6Q57_020095 [Mikania cordata]
MMLQLEDIIWDEFENSGDHIVPHPTDNQGCEDICEAGACKKPRLDVTPIQSSEERGSKTLNQETNMMEKDSWSNMLDDVFSASNDADSAKDAHTVGSGTKPCTDEETLKDSSGAVDRDSYNDLSLFSNDGDYKESSGHLSYNWPDSGYFEDVDRMLSNYDLSFGLGSLGHDDELAWFTSEDPARGFEETVKMDLKLPCSEPSALTNISQDHEHQESANKTSSFVSESKDELENNNQKELSRRQNLAEGLKHNDSWFSSSDKSEKKFATIDNCHQIEHLGHDSVDYMQSSGFLHQSDLHAPVQSTSALLMTGIKSEIKASAELDSLDMPGGSSLSTELDEISLEATAFRQLQQVMLQLDLRTKLCIRDSLYRLARSAEQRHNFAGVNNSTANRRGTGGPLVTGGANKYTGLMDMETDTNPIDRTVAHLLFHRPSDSSNMPASIPLKPNVKVQGSTTGPSKKPSCQQVENESDDKISSTGKN